MGVGWPHIHQAPALIVICARRATPFSRDDCIFAAANVMLAAQDEGLATCWIGGFNEDRLKRVLAIPENWLLPGFCTVGYAAGETAPPPKRPLGEMVHRDTFRGIKSGVRRLKGPLEVIGRIIKLQFRKR